MRTYIGPQYAAVYAVAGVVRAVRGEGSSGCRGGWQQRVHGGGRRVGGVSGAGDGPDDGEPPAGDSTRVKAMSTRAPGGGCRRGAGRRVGTLVAVLGRCSWSRSGGCWKGPLGRIMKDCVNSASLAGGGVQGELSAELELAARRSLPPVIGSVRSQEEHLMKTIAGSALVLGATVWMAASAVDAADQDADSTAVGWAESYSSSAAAQQAVLGECSSRGGGSGCIVRVWGCNGPVVEEGLGLDRAARRAIQEGLQAAGFDHGGADGMFGARTRSAIRSWQRSRGSRATGYLDGASVSSLRPSVAGQPTFFRDCPECPEMVVLAGGVLAMGRYEVTVGEYRAFVSAMGGTGNDRWRDHDWFPQTDRHPVALVNWYDAQEYVSWLSRRTGATYRLPTEVEWERAAAGSPAGVGCVERRIREDEGTCPVGQYGTNAAGLSDMVGNLWEWTVDCWEGDCGRRVFRGGSWGFDSEGPGPGARYGISAGARDYSVGFRVSRTLN